MDVDDKDNWSCSAAFKLTEVEEVVVDEDADWHAGMTVVSPAAGDLAYAGREYTVLVRESKENYFLLEEELSTPGRGQRRITPHSSASVGCRLHISWGR